MTQYYNFKENICEKEMKQCGEIIRKNGLVIFPTETVYGIGANALSQEAVEKIYQAKGRATDNPLIVHVSNREMIAQVAEMENEIEKKLIQHFMPGPFTLILKKKKIIPPIVSAGLPTVGIRIPENNIARSLIESAGVPIAAPSANLSGRPSGTCLQDIQEEFRDKVEAMIDGGKVAIGLESTVVKVIDNIPTILRPGKITPTEIEKVIGSVKINEKVMQKVTEGEIVESPGMKYRHYAPKTECRLVCGTSEEQVEKINQICQRENCCILGFQEEKEKIQTKHFICLGSRGKLEEVAQNLFSALRQADTMDVKLILIESVKEEELGLAIMNRLIRTCEYKMI